MFRGTSGRAACSGNLRSAQGTKNTKQVKRFFRSGLGGLSVTVESRGLNTAHRLISDAASLPATQPLFFFRASDLTESREVVVVVVRGGRVRGGWFRDAGVGMEGRIRISSCSPSNGGEDTAAVTPS